MMCLNRRPAPLLGRLSPLDVAHLATYAALELDNMHLGRPQGTESLDALAGLLRKAADVEMDQFDPTEVAFLFDLFTKTGRDFRLVREVRDAALELAGRMERREPDGISELVTVCLRICDCAAARGPCIRTW